MQYNASTANTNRLIAVAQTAANADDRNPALHELWRIHGDRLVCVMAKKSCQIDSDFSYRGCSFKERQDNLMGDAYLVFYEAVMSFDSSKGVPFAAYVAQKGNWHIADEKRENSKRGGMEKCVDFTVESLSSCDEADCATDLAFVRKALKCNAGFDDEIYWKEMLFCIYQATEPNSRLHKYFGACIELLHEGFDYSDAEIARRMGCTRANIGVYKKALIRMMKEDWRFENVCPRTAA